MPAEPEDVLEADEMWSFVHKRWNKRWLWTVMCRRTRQIVAFVIGDRSETTCRKLWEQIPQTYRAAKVTAISGKRIHSSFQQRLMHAWPKAVGRPTTWSVGITL